jgi:hypothetical protein
MIKHLERIETIFIYKYKYFIGFIYFIEMPLNTHGVLF